LFTSFVRVPDPAGPQWKIVDPMPSSRGLTRPKFSGEAPTMNSDSPRSAWLASRPTGASTKPMPRAWAAAASSSEVSGDTVLMSMITVPGLRFANTPSVRPMTSRTTAEFGSIVTTMSDCDATSATLAVPRACNASSSCTAVGSMSFTTRRNPLRHRFDAIGRPMRPSPMNPTASMRLLPVLRFHAGLPPVVPPA